MPNLSGQTALAASVVSAAYKQTSAGWNQIIYTTQYDHNFRIGQKVSVTGITGGTNANVTNLGIVSVPSSKTFIVASSSVYTTTSAPVVTYATALTKNTWSNLSLVSYATPVPTIAAPYYLDINPNIQASIGAYPNDGTVNIQLTWNASGGSEPLAAISVTQNIGTATTTLISGTAPAVGSLLVTGLTADVIYSFGITASNIFKTTSSTTTNISVPKYITAMNSITTSTVASTATTLNVSWVKPDTASPAISSYELQRASSTNNLTWSNWETLSNSLTATSYTDSVLTSGTYYRYQVRAFNGLTTPYITGSATLPFFLTDPMNIPAVSYDSAGTKSLKIGAPTVYLSNPAVTEWTIDRSVDATTWSTIATTSSLPYTDSSVNLDTTYYYRIKAKNGELTAAYSDASNGLLTYNIPNAPTGLTATPSTTSASVIGLSWTAATVPAGSPAVSNYKLERSETSNFTGTTAVILSSAISPSATTYTDTGRSVGVPYYYRLSSISTVGTSAVSSTATATITLISGSASISRSPASQDYYNTSQTYTVTTNANRTINFQTSSDNSNWTTYETKTLTGGATSTTFSYVLTDNAGTTKYFRAVVNQNATYTETTSGVDSIAIIANYIYPTTSVSGGNFNVWVTDVNGAAVPGVTVTYYYRQYGFATPYYMGSYTGWANTTTNASGFVARSYGSPGASQAYAVILTKANYNTYDGRGDAGPYVGVQEATGYVAQDNYGSYAENSSWGARAGGDGGYMYSGWWSTAQGRQAGAAYWSSGLGGSHPWAKINRALSIDGVFINITRIGGTGSSAMNISYGVHNSATKISNFNSLGKATNLLWGAANAPAYSAGNNRDYGTSLAGLKDYFRDAVWSTGAKGLTFGHTTEAATQGNYAVINNNVELYLQYVANPFL